MIMYKKCKNIIVNSVMALTPFVKQLFVASSPMLAALSVGGASSYPIVLLHQLRANDTSIPLDFDTASWIGSIHGLAGIPTIFVPHIMQWRGRKLAFIAACIITTIGWIIAYNAKSAAAILISESFHGLGSNSVLAIAYLSLSEMISPKYRHTYMNMYGIIQCFAMAVNGIMTQFIHWRTISIIMGVPMVIAMIVACMWPESPYWLALKGHYSKCEKAFVWLRGTDDESKKEMVELINAHKRNAISHRNEKKSVRIQLKTLSGRDFYLPCLHMIVLQYLFYWSGNFVILIYSIELIEKSTQNSNAAFYGALLMNSILCLGILTNIFLLKIFKKKSIMVCCAYLASISMLCASLISFSQTSGLLSKSSLFCLYALIAYMIANAVGIMPIAYIVAVEIMPVKHRGIGGSLIVLFSCILHTSALKISPYLFFYIDLWGTFLLYSFNAIICASLIWKFIPDTSGKTLQDIELYYNFDSSNKETIQEEIEYLPIDKKMETFEVSNDKM